MTWQIEQTPVGRIVVPGGLPDRLAVFCTSADFEGRLDASTVSTLSRLLHERFGFDGALASCGQVHGATVATVVREAGPWTETPSCDALVSLDGEVALTIKIADCLPVSLFDTDTGRTANVHSGWRGAAARIVPAALDRMKVLHGTRPASLRAWLGPSIRVCCFEVGEEVVDAMEAAWAGVESFVDRSRGPRPHFDLPGLTTRALESAGVERSAIDDSGLCTRCSSSIFHSFRRDRDRAGRNLMVIARG